MVVQLISKGKNYHRIYLSNYGLIPILAERPYSLFIIIIIFYIYRLKAPNVWVKGFRGREEEKKGDS